MIDWHNVPGEVITVISDLHSNKRAIQSAFNSIGKKRSDKVIILGDIFTYGIDVQETFDMVNDIISNGAELLIGNHDEMYLELINGNCKIFEKLRPDLQESIMYNLSKLDTKQFTNWPWKKQIIHNNILFSHANPYGNCWEYVKDIYDFREAANKIKNMKHIAGVFGHTHRSKLFSNKQLELQEIKDNSDDIFILNPGSIGQPRGDAFQGSFLRVSSYENRLWAEIEPIQYDVKGHINDLIASSLSDNTKLVLTSFYTKGK